MLNSNGHLPVTDRRESSNKKRRLDADQFCIYIVEIDNYEIGYSDAQACPSCTAALIKSGIARQYYTTPNGYSSEPVKYNPQIS